MSVAIVGGGIIGLSIAWYASRQGLRVTVFDQARLGAASSAAAGLLITAGGRISPSHLALKSRSRELYPGFVKKLETESQKAVGFRSCGSLTVAYGPDAWVSLEGLAACITQCGVPVERLSQRECLLNEPSLSPEVGGGFLTPDHQIDPGKLLAALRAACLGRGVAFFSEEAHSVTKNSVSTAVRAWRGDKVVVANGAWLRELCPIDVFPVRGEIIELKAHGDCLQRNVILQKSGYYIANRGEGELVVGATENECGFQLNADSSSTLTDFASCLVPALKDATVTDHRVGFRPKVRDGLPVLGPQDGVLLAGAHYRNGVQLAPVTAELITELLITDKVPELMEPFLPKRKPWGKTDS